MVRPRRLWHRAFSHERRFEIAMFWNIVSRITKCTYERGGGGLCGVCGLFLHTVPCQLNVHACWKRVCVYCVCTVSTVSAPHMCLCFYYCVYTVLRLRGRTPYAGSDPALILPLSINANHLPRLQGLTRLLCSSKFVGFDLACRVWQRFFCVCVNRKPGLVLQYMELFHL